MPNNIPINQHLEAHPSSEHRIRQILNWAKQRFSLSTTAIDKTTRQSVSNPSSPRLVRIDRLTSTSADNIIRNMDDETYFPSRSAIMNNSLSNEEFQPE